MPNITKHQFIFVVLVCVVFVIISTISACGYSDPTLKCATGCVAEVLSVDGPNTITTRLNGKRTQLTYGWYEGERSLQAHDTIEVYTTSVVFLVKLVGE